jgi:enamine deaminase RidA (YjgF/YER057c/UK114 family)
MSFEENFQKLGAEIPERTTVAPSYSFALVRRAHNLVFLAGHGPNRLKQPPQFDYVGKVGGDLTREQGREAARLVGLNLLVTLRASVGTLDRVSQVLHLLGAVNSAPGFTDQSYVLNGCSDLLRDIFGNESGTPTRMAIGAAELPFNMAVEASLVVELRANV